MTERKRAGKRVKMSCTGESRTQQQFETEADINFIVKKYMRTGVLPGSSNQVPEYADATGVGYQGLLAAYEATEAAEEEFMRLEPSVRTACQNDPAVFLKLLETPAGSGLLQAAGLDVKGSRYETRSPEPPEAEEVLPKAPEAAPVVGGE